MLIYHYNLTFEGKMLNIAIPTRDVAIIIDSLT
jgi:hypothetical protein